MSKQKDWTQTKIELKLGANGRGGHTMLPYGGWLKEVSLLHSLQREETQHTLNPNTNRHNKGVESLKTHSQQSRGTPPYKTSQADCRQLRLNITGAPNISWWVRVNDACYLGYHNISYEVWTHIYITGLIVWCQLVYFIPPPRVVVEHWNMAPLHVWLRQRDAGSPKVLNSFCRSRLRFVLPAAAARTTTAKTYEPSSN